MQDYEGYNLVEEGVLLLRLDKILFANKNALNLFGWSSNHMEQMKIGNVPLSSNRWLLTEQKVSFEEMVKKSIANQIVFNQYFTLDTLKKTVKVKISPSADSVWCIISTIQTPQACTCDKKNEWYDKFAQMNVLTCVVVEYYSELQDWKVLFMPKFAANHIHVPTDCEGNFVIRDMKLRPELVAQVFTQDKLDDNSPLPEGIIVKDFAMEGVKENQGKTFYRRLKSQYLGRSNEGRPIKVMTASDITDLRLCEIELENRQKILSEAIENQENLRVLFDNFPTMMGIVEITDEGKIREIITNPMTLEYNKKRKTFALDDKEKEDEFWISKYLESKRLGKPVYFEMPDDQYGYFYCSAKHLKANQFIFMCDDFTELRELQRKLEDAKNHLEDEVQSRTKQLQEALEVKSRFLAVMSHEIRTPLSGIVASLSLLSETSLDDEQKQILQTAQVCGDQLMYLINDILDLRSMEENKLRLENTPFNVRDIVRDSVAMVSMEAEKKGLMIDIQMDDGIPCRLVGDPTRLRQVLINLLSNSVKFSYAGTVLLSIQRSTNSSKDLCMLDFKVQDHGIGIPEQVQSSIFQPFFQADSSVRRKFGGSGLGLNISKKLVELMNGSMSFDSKEGVGSTFYFHIPFAVSDTIDCQLNGTVPATVMPVPNVAPDSVPVLIAEDNYMNQQVIRRIMKNIGFNNIKIVDNGLKAVEEMENNSYKVILMDCMMPVMSGFEATIAIRKNGKKKQPAIIALTADAFPETAKKCKDVGMDCVITKPIDRKKLQLTLYHYIEQLKSNC